MAALVAALAAIPTPLVAAQAATGPIIGAYAQPTPGQSNIDAVIELEQTLGTTLPMVRGFSKWDAFIGADKPLHVFVRDGGRDLMVSVKPTTRDGVDIPWVDIATAQPGSPVYDQIVTMASGIRRFEAPIIFNFHHEADAQHNIRYGTADEFQAAFRRIRSIFESEGVTNVQYAVVLTEWSFEVGEVFPNDRRRAELWYPGDDVVDIIGSDEYNWNNCRGNTTDPWISLEDDLAPFLRFADLHPDKPLLLGEFGSDDGAPGQKAEWIRQAHDFFSESPDGDRFLALLYFHDDGLEENWLDCDWWLDTSPESTAAAIEWFGDPAFRGRLETRESQSCAGREATIAGTVGDDVLVGTSGNDVIAALGGDDDISGLTGDDIICGGPGDDTIRGLGGADLLFGNHGADVLLGGYGPDYIDGGEGPDRINGQFGNDSLFGSGGNDTLRGGPHQDEISGGPGQDRMFGQGGFDTLIGGAGDDTIFGGVGADSIFGDSGQDRCIGGEGRDFLECETAR